MRPEELEAELLLYWIQYRELEEKGGPENDGDLFEEVFGREEDILQFFGLPPAEKYSRILWKLAGKKSCSPKTVKKTIAKLQEAAFAYLAKPVKPSLQMLQEAQIRKTATFNALPELGFNPHVYTVFLYENLLLQLNASPAAILAELETVHKNDLYNALGKLANNLKPTSRRTKAYKLLKSQLQFLDVYLAFETDQPMLLPETNQEETFEFDEILQKISREIRPEPVTAGKPNYPEYKELLGSLEIKEIIFDESEAVTVYGHYFSEEMTGTIGLGFEFDELYNLLAQYEHQTSALSYFNKSRQRHAIDTPTIINLKDKTGKNLFLEQHYLRIYKPEAMNRDDRRASIPDNFYLVDAILEKRAHDTEMQDSLRKQLNGMFHHVLNWYGMYLSAKSRGLSEQEARNENALEDPNLFELSRMLWYLQKHGGRPQMKE